MSEKTASTRIVFNTANAVRCMCAKCPVQSASACVKSLTQRIKEALTKDPLNREDIPGLYCSAGTATCEDLDYSKMCMCPNCPVYLDYQLSDSLPDKYFCRDGAST